MSDVFPNEQSGFLFHKVSAYKIVLKLLFASIDTVTLLKRLSTNVLPKKKNPSITCAPSFVDDPLTLRYQQEPFGIYQKQTFYIDICKPNSIHSNC